MAVFGEVSDADPTISTSAFILIIILLIIMEAVWKFFGYLAKRYDYEQLFIKLSNEMLIMGLVSFLTYLFFDYPSFKDKYSTVGIWYQAMHMIHIVIFFIALSFIFKAIFFISSINKYTVKLSIYEFLNPVEIIHYHNILKSLPKPYIYIYSYQYFRSAYLWLQFFIQPQFDLTMSMEIQLLAQYFKKKHGLPSSFNFTAYVALVGRRFIMEFGEVSPITWLILSVLATINFLKIQVFDKFAGTFVCGYFNHENTRRCWEYDVTNIVAYGFLLNAFTIYLIIITMVSMNRLICKVLINTNNHQEITEISATEYKDFRFSGTVVLEKYLLLLGKELLADDTIVDSYDIQKHQNRRRMPIHEDSISFTDNHVRVTSKSIYSDNEDTISTTTKANTLTNILHVIYEYLLGKYAEREYQSNVDTINEVYSPKSARFYFFSLELVLLIQSVYLSLCATQYAVIIGKDLDGNVGWIIVWQLVILSPLFVSFISLYFILFFAALLKASTLPDMGLCHSTLNAQRRRQSLRRMLHDNILDQLKQRCNRDGSFHLTSVNYADTVTAFLRDTLLEIFKNCVGSSQEMNKSQFSMFIDKLNVRSMTSVSVDELFNSVDVNKSGAITWDEIAIVCFPFEREADYLSWEEEYLRSQAEMQQIDRNKSGIKHFLFNMLDCCCGHDNSDNHTIKSGGEVRAPAAVRKDIQRLRRLSNTPHYENHEETSSTYGNV